VQNEPTSKPTRALWADIPRGGQYAKWEDVGDRVVGTVTGTAVGSTMDGTACPEITVKTEDGDELTITAAQAMLKAALMDDPPEVGDVIDIKFVGVDTRGGRTLKKFLVTVVRDGEAI